MADQIKLTDIVKEPGVEDLPMSVKGKFALAIRAEMRGDIEKAEKKLAEAIAAEKLWGERNG